MNRTLSTLLTGGRADGRCDEAAFARRGGSDIPFGSFRADVARAADQLSGVHHAILACHDSYAFAVGLFALLHVGAEVKLPHNPQSSAASSPIEQIDRIVSDDLLSAPGLERSLTALDPAKPCIHFYTSGSTGEPKRVSKTLGMLAREVAVYDTLWRAAQTLATVTHQHLYGLTFRVLWPIAAGRPFAAETHEFWESLLTALTPGAIIVSSPAHLGRLGGLAPVEADRRPSIVFSAGAPLSDAAARAAREVFGVPPTEIFGSTETGAFATRLRDRIDPLWRLLPSNEMSTDADGRLQITSSYVPHPTTTGDMVEPQPGGFQFKGRADRIAKIEGKRISLIDVEAALCALPWIDHAAAVMVLEEPPKLVAAVTLNGEGRHRLSTLGKFQFGRLLRRSIAEVLGPAGAPRRWRFVEALPEMIMGKRDDAQIAALFEGAR